MQQGRCIFLQRTSDGERCVLLPPEDWAQLKQKYLHQFCLNQGHGCPVYERVLSAKRG
ncbi:metal-binding protein [Caldivirga maquilingensis]|uniref:metal-binding protein n=1 Tax=Caldivirga maquilingensis TaxID=76887 RepID=UPI000B20CC3E|nr:metal-binding protein [Caldivirga maquilingensis]